MMKHLMYKSFARRHAISAGAAVFAAVFINHYYGFTHECWIVLTAYLVGQTTKGTPLRQGMMRFLGVVTAILLSGAIMSTIKQQDINYFITGLLFVLGAQIAFISRQQEHNIDNVVTFFIIVLLIGTLAPEKFSIYDRLKDVMFGAVIGIISAKLIFPVRLENEFRDGVASILRSLNEYSQTLSATLARAGNTPAEAAENSDLQILLKQQNRYPEWVFEVGFNPGLRPGFRFFLVNLDRISEIYVSIEYYVNQTDAQLLREISASMCDALKSNQELLQIMLEYFVNSKLAATSSDYISDITVLENTLNRLVPANLELLDISPDNIFLTAIVRDIKDLRNILLQLVMALPTRQLVPVKSSF